MQKKIINKSFLFLLLFLLAGGKMVAQQTLIDKSYNVSLWRWSGISKPERYPSSYPVA